jgi:hypothetical protein
MRLVGSNAFEHVGGFKFVDPADIDDPTLENFDFVPVNLPPELLGRLPDLSDRAVMIVGNAVVRDYGPIIDHSDCVIRLNSMYNWKEDPQHDGTRVTIWAGLPGFAVTPHRASPDQWANSCFARIAPTLDMIWCVSPYQCSARAYRWLRDAGMLSKFSSISDPLSILDNHIGRLPPQLASKLFSMPVLFNGSTGITNFELLLTGVKTVLLAYLSEARRIHLCGFDFFEKGNKEMWLGHDREINLAVVRFVRDACIKEGRDFFWREQALIDP